MRVPSGNGKPVSSGTFAGAGSCKCRQHRALGFRWWDPFLHKHPRTRHDRVEHSSFGREQVTRGELPRHAYRALRGVSTKTTRLHPSADFAHAESWNVNLMWIEIIQETQSRRETHLALHWLGGGADGIAGRGRQSLVVGGLPVREIRQFDRIIPTHPSQPHQFPQKDASFPVWFAGMVPALRLVP
jgi:hypothetical protein